MSTYALRADAKAYSAGSVMPASRIWIDGDATNELLPGTCGLRISGPVPTQAERAAMRPYLWTGQRLYVIAGDPVMSGEDDGEVILSGAVVVTVAS